MTGQEEPVDVVHLDFCQAFDSVCDRLLIKKMAVMGIHVKINRYVHKFLKKRTFIIKFGDHLPHKGTEKMVPRALCLDPFCS